MAPPTRSRRGRFPRRVRRADSSTVRTEMPNARNRRKYLSGPPFCFLSERTTIQEPPETRCFLHATAWSIESVQNTNHGRWSQPVRNSVPQAIGCGDLPVQTIVGHRFPASQSRAKRPCHFTIRRRLVCGKTPAIRPPESEVSDSATLYHEQGLCLNDAKPLRRWSATHTLPLKERGCVLRLLLPRRGLCPRRRGYIAPQGRFVCLANDCKSCWLRSCFRLR